MVLSICACLISIHALREEGDKMYRDSYNLHIMISIHALREEGDVAAVGLGRSCK